MSTRSIHTLMSGLVDYAGLYPPAKLDMATSVDKYATYLRDPHSWMLGRFILPVSRLEEFRLEAHRLLPTTPPPATNGGTDPSGKPWEEPWKLSAIIDGDLNENLDAIFAFNHEHQDPKKGLANIDAIEIKGSTVGFIDSALDTIPEELFPFFEIPLGAPGKPADTRGLIACLAGTDAAAKIRTGGVTADAFPACESIADFLVGAAAADVAFKATAGLHHPVRAEYPLTYEPKCPRGVMHGFLNVFLGATLARETGDAALVAKLLGETDPRAFRASDDGIRWNDRLLRTDSIDETRGLFALSYGSCSFDEPVDELKSLGML